MLNLCMKIQKEDQWGELIKAVFRPLEEKENVGGMKTTAVETIQEIYKVTSMQQHPFIL